MYYIGCDQRKRYSFVVVKDPKGKTLNRIKLYHADRDNMKDYFKALPKRAEVGDINRFANHHKFARYTGIVPSLHQSGQILYQGRITKQGNKYLRTAFVESAQTAIRRDPYLSVKFNKIKSKKGYGAAIAAIAHKLAKSTYVVLKKQCKYRYRIIIVRISPE